MIQVIKERQELLGIKEQWDRLFEIADHTTPFQSFDYTYASLDLVINSELHVIILKAEDEKDIRAIFPCVLTSKSVLEFINARHTDFCGPIISPKFDNYSLYKEFSEYISNNKDIKGCLFENIMYSTPLTATLKPKFPFMITRDCNFYSYFTVKHQSKDKNFIDSFSTLTAKQRNYMRKEYKEFKNNCTFLILSSDNNDPYPEDYIKHLVHSMIDSEIRSQNYLNSNMTSMWKKLYDSGILTFALLIDNDSQEPITCGFMLIDKKRNDYIQWLILYKESYWNKRTYIALSEYLYAHNGGIINFARGIYSYKIIHFHPDVKPLFCVMIAKTKWGHIKNIAKTVFYYTKPVIKSLLGRK